MSKQDKTYGVKVGQVYVPADGSKGELKVMSIDTKRGDAIVLNSLNSLDGEKRSIDLFKLAMVRYKLKESQEQINESKVPDWFESGAKVKFVDGDNEIFTLKNVDEEAGKAFAADKNGSGWNVRHYQVYPARGKKPISESSRAKGLNQKTGYFYLTGHGSETGRKVVRSDSFASRGEAVEHLKEFKEKYGDWAIKINLMRQHPGGPLKLELLKVYNLNENTDLQNIGKELKGKKSEVADEPVVDEAPEVVEPEVVEPVPAELEYKVGDLVKPLKGLHKGEPHEVIHVYDNGSMNIKPKDLSADQIKYKKGAAKAEKNEVEPYEITNENYKFLSIFKKGSLIAFADDRLDEDDEIFEGCMPLSHKPGKGHKIEAYGRKGMKSVQWRKYFKDSDAMVKWCEDNDATVEGTRELDKNELKEGKIANAVLGTALVAPKTQRDYTIYKSALIAKNKPYLSFHEWTTKS